jgi:hypothetical protein
MASPSERWETDHGSKVPRGLSGSLPEFSFRTGMPPPWGGPLAVLQVCTV